MMKSAIDGTLMINEPKANILKKAIKAAYLIVIHASAGVATGDFQKRWAGHIGEP